ncbi:MAG: long-chain fatty acid--CoA ligase [Actinobacteria bacterium]|nr:MAG: long-chain fatty acid--CoA ligase [Actinomycetota bacterium]
MNVPELDVTPTVPAVLRRAVERFGDRDYIVTPQRRMTFAQAEAGSRRLAKELLIAGVGKGTRVGFVYPYGTDWVVVWLAAARIGALCLPFSTVLAPGELRKAVRHGDVDTLVMPDTLRAPRAPRACDV